VPACSIPWACAAASRAANTAEGAARSPEYDGASSYDDAADVDATDECALDALALNAGAAAPARSALLAEEDG
jgi:hypothetical protein